MLIEWPFFLMLGLLVAVAASALLIRDLLTAILLLSVFSIVATVIFAFLQAADVAMAEATIGAGLLTAAFVTTLAKTKGDS